MKEALGTFLEDVAGSTETNSGRICCAIPCESDHGSGIDPAKMEKMFRRFILLTPHAPGKRPGRCLCACCGQGPVGLSALGITPRGGRARRFTIVLPASQTRMFLDRDHAEAVGDLRGVPRREQGGTSAGGAPGRRRENQPAGGCSPAEICQTLNRG